MSRPMVLACRPVQLDLNSPIERMAAAETFVYDDSIQWDCEMCHRKVWVGPKQQQVLAVANVVCFTCAATFGMISPDGQNIKSLGNPQRNPHGTS